MGIDAGFDMVPRLTKSAEHRFMWQAFIECVREKYEEDDQVEITAKYIEFKVGEHPRLPMDGHKFLRFSSKISGQGGQQAENYITDVSQIASGFGSRIRRWNEMYDRDGFYDWGEVHDSLRSYEQDRTSEGLANSTLDVQTSKTGESKQPCYSIEPIPKRGKGLVARVSIPSGARIIAEKPLFKAISWTSGPDSVIVAKVKALSREDQRHYLSLHNNYAGANPFNGIFKTNALPCGPDSPVGAVYPTICLINHDCRPNSYHNWNDSTSTETIHASRDIKAGEEITISYAGGETSHQRLAKLETAFGFKCTCELCSLPESQLQESDARRLEMDRLDQSIGDGSQIISNPASALAHCQRMQQLLKDEYNSCPPLEARLYYDAFQISIVHADQARASVFAEKAYKARLLGEGEDSPETIKMKGFMGRPAEHQNYRVSKRWRTSKSAVPKGLGDKEFEEWLWRRTEK